MKRRVWKIWRDLANPAKWFGEAERRYEGPREAEALALDLSAERVARVLLLVTAGLVAWSLVTGLVGVLGGPFMRLFYVGADLSIPAWYSALVLVLASVLLAIIAWASSLGERPRHVRRWAVLAAIFAYLSCDEMLRLHERLAETALRPALDTLGFVPGGILYYPWVLVYAPLVAIFALAYFDFWRELPQRTRRLFLAAGLIFVGGALGVELFNAYHDEAPGRVPLVFAGTHVEESLEMVGAIVFVYALMSYLGSWTGLAELRIRLARPL